MKFDYLVFPNYNKDNFESACAMIEALLTNLNKRDYILGVDGPVQNYECNSNVLTVYGRVRDDVVFVSSEFEIPYLKSRPVCA